MNVLKSACRVTTLAVSLTMCASVWALPITFEFSGTVTDTVIYFNERVKKFTSHPEWNGKQVTGSVTLNLDSRTPGWDGGNDNFTEYSGFGSPAEVNWMSLRIENPDGTFFDSRDATFTNPNPSEPITDMSYTHLSYLSRNTDDETQSNFYLSSQYQGDSSRPMNLAQFLLTANGENVGLLFDTVDFADVTIKPEFANMFNYAVVYQATSTDYFHNYYFNVDTFKRVESNVPEPAALLLLLSGLFVMARKRNKLGVA